MTNIIKLDTSVNIGKATLEGETAMLLGGENFFKRKNETKTSVENIIDSTESVNEDIEESAKVFCLFYDLAGKLKDEFEEKYHQKINNSLFRKEIDMVFQSHLDGALLYLSDSYSLYPEGYINALLKKRLQDFQDDINKILQESFGGYAYSKYRSAEYLLAELGNKYSQLMYGKT